MRGGDFFHFDAHFEGRFGVMMLVLSSIACLSNFTPKNRASNGVALVSRRPFQQAHGAAGLRSSLESVAVL